MSDADATPQEPHVHVTTTDNGGAEVRVTDPITRPELDARFREIKTRIWFVAATGFFGSAIGGSLRTGLTPHTALEMIGRML